MGSFYLQTVEMTHEEKVKMYMKLSKKEIIAMLLENQRIVESYRPEPRTYNPFEWTWSSREVEV